MDYVYPLHFLDDLKLNRMPVHWLLHFNDILDAQKLREALTKLLGIGDWRKLGGRLRSKGKGRLEIHVPSRWTFDRPAFAYYHETLSQSLSEHRLAGSLGTRPNGPCTQPLAHALQTLMTVPGTPTRFKEWVDRDVPLLSVRITSFADATLVAFSWPHSLMDASGARAFLQAWSFVVAGKESHLPPLLGSHEDVLMEALRDNLESEKRQELALERWRLKGRNKLEFMLRLVGGLSSNIQPEVRRIYIPNDAIKRLKAQAKEEIKEEAETGAFVTENSVLTAWLTRIVAMSESKPRPITQLSTMNARFRLQQVKRDALYVQNMILPSYTFLPASISRGSVGQLALEQQHQMKERASEQQTLAILERYHSLYHSGRDPLLSLLVGKKEAGLVVFNNLTKVGVIQATDFGAAVLTLGNKQSMDRGGNAPGTPINFVVHTEPEKLVSFVCITGKDHAGNYWLIANLKPRTWLRLEEELHLL
ncbi:hypothetical protein AMS68_002256 [Peltaster fructicola]|uniref:Uncharacterized protein n=1 Tax=Peltaster fructicola TaxID=286661 RepID=A0A6H0XQ40_9PEZI|nr:hypothetical protein AMS68_002256 [Peltaster fructicola]